MNDLKPNEHVVTFSGDEYLYLTGISESFLYKEITGGQPEFVIVAGGPGSGKSTIIKDKYNNDHVLVDAAKIHLAITENESKKAEKYNSYFDFIGMHLVACAIEGKKNIIVEIIGDKMEPIRSIIDKLIEKGYKVDFQFINCDPEEAWKRNLQRDQLNISAVHTQDQTLSWFVRYLGLE
jgi:predicted kinase